MPLTAAITGFQRSHDFGPRLSPGSLNMNGVLPLPTTSGSVVSLRLAAHLLHAVDAGAERLLAGAGEHDAAHRVVAAQRAPQRVQLALHQRVERVVHVGPVQRDGRDTVGLFVRDRLELGNARHWTDRCGRQERRWASMPGALAAERVAVEDAADVGRVPLLRRCRPCRWRGTARPSSSPGRARGCCRRGGAPDRSRAATRRRRATPRRAPSCPGSWPRTRCSPRGSSPRSSSPGRPCAWRRRGRCSWRARRSGFSSRLAMIVIAAMPALAAP